MADALVAHRRIELIVDPEDPWRVDALWLEVLVLWIDHSDPTAPAPAELRVDALTPAMIDPTDAAFLPWVGHVRLTGVRLNDARVEGGAGP